MTSQSWATLAAAAVPLIVAVTALIRAETAHAKVNATKPVAKNNDTSPNA